MSLVNITHHVAALIVNYCSFETEYSDNNISDCFRTLLFFKRENKSNNRLDI